MGGGAVSTNLINLIQYYELKYSYIYFYVVRGGPRRGADGRRAR